MKFFGVRGSCPCSSDTYRRYGGNTSCVVVEPDDGHPIIVDLGTGLRPLGQEWAASYGRSGPPEITALLTHLHWDHLIGLPFFTPIQQPGATMTLYGPPQEGGGLQAAIDRVVQPPFFPVEVKELHGGIDFHEVADDDLAVGSAKIRVRLVPHLGTTLGFRIEADGVSVAYVSDHQAPHDLAGIDPGVLDLCDGADLVIHDAQYTGPEFAAKEAWGHSTAAYAVHVAAQAGARRLALFHHDPAHGDDEIDRLVEEAGRLPAAARLDAVVGAAEGLTLELGPH